MSEDKARQGHLDKLKLVVDALREEARLTDAGKLTARQLGGEIAVARREHSQREQAKR